MNKDLMINRFYKNLTKNFMVTPEEFKVLEKVLKTKLYKKGEQIISEGEVEKYNKVVVSGIVHQYVFVNERKVTIDITLAGMYFNSFKSYMDKTPSTEIHEAITDVALIYFEGEEFRKLTKTEHWLSCVYVGILEMILLERENRSFLLQHKKASDKFKLFMKLDRAPLYLKEVSQKLIAEYLSIAPETYSKVKKEYFQKK